MNVHVLTANRVIWVALGLIVHVTVYKYAFPAVFSATSKTYKKYLQESQLNKKAEWDSRGTSTFHAILASSAAVYTFLVAQEFNDFDLLRITPFCEIWLMFSLGYFLYDIFIIFKYFPGDYSSLVHHCIAISIHILICATGTCTLIQMGYVLTEMSTPFVNARFFLMDSGMRNSKTYVANGLLMFVTFFVFRMPMIPFVPVIFYIKYDQYLKIPMLVRCVYLLLYVLISTLNLIWFYKITRGVIKTLTTPQKIN